MNEIKLKRILKKRRKKTQDDHLIVFVAQFMSPRLEKIGYALRKKGYKVILLLHEEGRTIGTVSGSRTKPYDKLSFFSGVRDLYMLCMSVRPLVYHVFTGSQVEDWAVFLVKNKRRIGKIVYDQYDIYRDMYAEQNSRIIENEKYCMEHADGLVCRSFQTQYLKEKYGYQFGKRRLLFLDYCWNRKRIKRRRKSPQEELRIVYGGYLSPRQSNSPLSQIEWEGLSAWVRATKEHSAKMVVVGSNLSNDYKFRDFYRLAKNNDNFILKEKMNTTDLILFESRMDYGTDTFELEKDQKIVFSNFNFEARETYCANNKYFDYLDAGIPIICGRPSEMLSGYLEKYGVVFRCTLEQLPEKMDELKRRRNEYADHVEIARKKFSIHRQIIRLLDFYKNI